MAKPTPITIPSDDCLVDGLAVHEGETVTLIPGLSVAAINAVNALLSISADLDAADGEPDQTQRQTALADGALQKLCTALAPRIVRWTWTDMAGRPLPQPDGKPDGLMVLESIELMWLLTAVKGETPARRGEG